MNKEWGKSIDKKLDQMNKDISTMLEFQSTKMKPLLDLITGLQKEIQRKNEVINDLENRVNDLEQNLKSDNIVISGLALQPGYMSYASSVKPTTGGVDTSTPNMEYSIESQVIKFFNNHQIEVGSNEIANCYRLGKMNKTQKPNSILLQLISKKVKNRVLKNSSKLKGTSVFLNEDLSRRNAEVAGIARKYRRRGDILKTWVRGGNIFIKMNGVTPESQSVHHIRNVADFVSIGLPVLEKQSRNGEYGA